MKDKIAQLAINEETVVARTRGGRVFVRGIYGNRYNSPWVEVTTYPDGCDPREEIHEPVTMTPPDSDGIVYPLTDETTFCAGATEEVTDKAATVGIDVGGWRSRIECHGETLKEATRLSALVLDALRRTR